MLEGLEDGHLLLEPCLLGLVVSVLLWRVRGEGGKEGRGKVLVSIFSTGRQHVSCLYTIFATRKAT